MRKLTSGKRFATTPMSLHWLCSMSAAEGQALVDADVLHPQGARLLEEARPTSSDRKKPLPPGPYWV